MSERSAFRIQRNEGGDLRHPHLVASFPDWTARERIAVECFKAMLGDPTAHDDYCVLAREAFKAADALILVEMAAAIRSRAGKEA